MSRPVKASELGGRPAAVVSAAVVTPSGPSELTAPPAPTDAPAPGSPPLEALVETPSRAAPADGSSSTGRLRRPAWPSESRAPPRPPRRRSPQRTCVPWPGGGQTEPAGPSPPSCSRGPPAAPLRGGCSLCMSSTVPAALQRAGFLVCPNRPASRVLASCRSLLVTPVLGFLTATRRDWAVRFAMPVTGGTAGGRRPGAGVHRMHRAEPPFPPRDGTGGDQIPEERALGLCHRGHGHVALGGLPP